LVLSSLPLFMFSMSLFPSVSLTFMSFCLLLYYSPASSSCSLSSIIRPFCLSYFHIDLFYSSSLLFFLFFIFHNPSILSLLLSCRSVFYFILLLPLLLVLFLL
jgi:hypothetical protein